MSPEAIRKREQDEWDHNWYARRFTSRPLSLEEEAKLKTERAEADKEEWQLAILGLVVLMVFAVADAFLSPCHQSGKKPCQAQSTETTQPKH